VVALRLLVALAAIASAACAPAYVVGANPSSCAAVVEHATNNPADPAIEPAAALVIYAPPQPPPPTARGHTAVIHMRVTERGLVEPGSVRVDSVAAMDYRRQLALNAQKMRFRPARLSGCWVPSTREIKFTFF
jgi:hypothetical protein